MTLINTRGTRTPNKINNTISDQVQITKDKLYVKLSHHLPYLNRKEGLLSLISLMVGLGTTLLTCNFKDALGIPCICWNFIFVLGFLSSVVCIIIKLIQLYKYRKENIDTIIEDILKIDD